MTGTLDTMIPMLVIGLSVDTATKSPMVVLQRQDGEETLAIWVGAMEAMAISLALSGNALPRPLTHDLLLSALNMLGGSLEGVDIHDMREGTYHADLLLRQGERCIRMDCRPSDGIALALRVGAPIRMAEAMLHRTETGTRTADPASPRHLRPQDAATDMMRQAAARMTATMSRMLDVDAEAAPARSAETADGDTEEQRLTELLQMLEPESSRRM